MALIYKLQTTLYHATLSKSLSTENMCGITSKHEIARHGPIEIMCLPLPNKFYILGSTTRGVQNDLILASFSGLLGTRTEALLFAFAVIPNTLQSFIALLSYYAIIKPNHTTGLISYMNLFAVCRY